MSVKLSELLHAATFYLSRAAKRFENESWDDPAADALSDKAVALRAIVPALVEAAEFITRQHSPPRKFPYCDCAGCVLTHEMEKAGVTCE